MDEKIVWVTIPVRMRENRLGNIELHPPNLITLSKEEYYQAYNYKECERDNPSTDGIFEACMMNM